MDITINEVEIETSPFDSLWIILNRYALPLEEALPSYFRFIKSDIVLSPDLELEVEDIRKTLQNIEPETLDEEIVRSLRLLYPELSIYDIIVLYVDLQYDEDEPNETLLERVKDIIGKDESIRAVRKKDFAMANIDSTIYRYREKTDKIRIKLKEELKRYDNNISQIKKLKPIPIQNFILESVEIHFLLSIPLSTPLINMFDLMNISFDVPFIHFHYRDMDYFKIDSKRQPPEEWLNEAADLIGRTKLESEMTESKREKQRREYGIYFKVFNAPRTKISARIKTVNLYSDGFWDINHEVSVNIKIRGGVDEKIMKDRFLSVLSPGRRDVIRKEVQRGVRGSFRSYLEHHERPFNRAIFSDMVSNNTLFSSFLYFNEVQTTPLLRKTLTFFYRQTEGSLKIFIKPQNDGLESWIDIIVANAVDIRQVESFKFLFSNLLRLYNNNYPSIYDRYVKYLQYLGGKTLLKGYEQDTAKKIDTKTGPRLQKLKSRYPDLFRPNYSKACSKKKQPYLIEPDELDDVIEQHGQASVVSLVDENTGENVYFGCLPREEGDEFMYAGLVKNKYYGDEVPLLPCCYTKDQTKNVEKIKKRMERGEAEKGKMTLSSKTGHLLAPIKLAPMNRLAKMPYYLNFMISDAGYKMQTINDIKMYPFLSLGMAPSADSFFHCVATAVDDDYIDLNLKDKTDFIREVKKELANSEDILNSSSQELYGYELSEIKDILLRNQFIDARMWIRAAELYFHCRIFLYKVSKEEPKGEILIPRHAEVYLRPKDSREISILIIQKEAILRDYDYQYELIVQHFPNKGNPYRFSFDRRDPIAQKALQYLREANTVSLISGVQEFPYEV